MRLAIAGGGDMGARLAATAAAVPGVEVAAVADPDVGRRDAVAAAAGCAGYADWHDLLRADDVDAIYIGLPHHLHAPAAVAAAERGLDILIDKPLCNTLDEADRMLTAAAEGGVTLMVGFSHRFHVELRSARDALRRGDLGTPLLASDVLVQGSLTTPSWYWSRDAGGGVLQLQAHHSFDRLAWLLDSPIVAVRAEVAGATAGLAESVATVGLRFANGALGSIALSFAHGYTGRAIVELVIQGTHGQLRLETWRSVEIETATTATVQRQTRDDWLYAELAEFVAAVSERRPPLAAGEDGRRALRCALAAAESAHTGRTVQLAP